MQPLTYDDQTILITGASSGLGVEYARRLAARGADLVLVARRADRLQALASELTERYGVTVTVIVKDLSEPGAGAELHERVTRQGVAVTALFNNAGFANSGAFHDIAPEDLAREVAVDVAAVVDVTRAFIDDLRAAPQGILVNLSSVAGYQPDPYLAVYGASKAFVLSFTESLHEEARGTALRVLAVSPGPTETEFFDVAGQGAAGGLPVMSAEDVVTESLAALERRSPPPSIVPGRFNRGLARAGRLMPRALVSRTAGAMMRRYSDGS
ncbi:SDR family NAD(P)-dependent oxidoreductase [Brachybacterium sp. AOP25-B2-12]|uniref:SDR family NAD(P)-dependent oxidoreductase n=1 Tax=Brachybacterium sp. AOP25-B2-12 TaxID=3457710 RepID=UPI0040338417